MTLFFNHIFYKKIHLTALLLLSMSGLAIGQIPDTIVSPPISANDTLPPNFLDTLRPVIPTNVLGKDTVEVNISKEALDEEVIYKAKDSMRLDAVNQVVYLYGEAEVKYTTITLTAGYIKVDMKNNLITAAYTKNIKGQKGQRPVFTEGSITPITADSMYYNFITKKGRILNTTTTQAGGYINSSVAKIIMKQDSIEHSSDELYGKDAIYTTCNHPEPHYGLRSSKQKVIPDKLVVVGPSNIEIMGIPTPLWLPFGFFPLTEGQSGGLIFPKDYEYSPNWGYGLRNIGWYFGLGEYADLQILGDIYTRGSWGVRGVSRYKKRYKYNGTMELGFSRRVSGDPIADNTSPKNAVKLIWNHSQDAKAHPSRRFSASVNIETNNFQRDNFNDAQSVLNSELTSRISYTKTFPGKPFNLSATFGHRQNVNTHDIRFNLPTVDFTMKRIFPFQSNRPGNKERWYEKIGIAYTGKVQNTITGKDTMLFQPDSLEFSYGAKHSVPISANFKIFKYINVSPFVNYSEKWYLNTLNRTFDNTVTVEIDTIFDETGEPIDIRTDTTFGEVVDIMDNGFRSLRELSGGVSFNTQLFGMVNFRRGPVRAIRHNMKPSVSFTYTPDYTNDFWGYWKEVRTDTRYPDELDRYNIFQGGLFGQASLGGGQSMSYNITNVFEAKVVNRRDTINPLQKIKLLQNLGITGNYNFAADSLKMSVINVNGNTMILKRINVSFGFTADPLAANITNNRRIDTYEWTQNRRIARWTSARLSANTRLDSKFFDELFGKKQPEPTQNNSDSPPNPTGTPTTLNQNNSNSANKKSNYGLLQNLSVNYSLALSRKYFDGVDSAYVSRHNISISGGTVNLTTNWKLRVGGVGYDFVRQTFTYPDFSLSRDLHCWETGFSWQPQRGTYAFYVRVKPGSQLDFLNVPYRRNNYDPLGGF